MSPRPKGRRCSDEQSRTSSWSWIPLLPWLPPGLTGSSRIIANTLHPNPVWALHPFRKQFAAKWILRWLIIGYSVGGYKFIFKINELDKNESSTSAGMHVWRGLHWTRKGVLDRIIPPWWTRSVVVSMTTRPPNRPPLFEHQHKRLDFNHKCNEFHATVSINHFQASPQREGATSQRENCLFNNRILINMAETNGNLRWPCLLIRPPLRAT